MYTQDWYGQLRDEEMEEQEENVVDIYMYTIEL